PPALPRRDHCGARGPAAAPLPADGRALHRVRRSAVLAHAVRGARSPGCLPGVRCLPRTYLAHRSGRALSAPTATLSPPVPAHPRARPVTPERPATPPRITGREWRWLAT